MEEALNKVNFLNRLGSLQNLTGDANSDYPKALLIISGQDSRHNKGSLACLKYLFLSSVSNDLFNDEFNPQAKVLDNMVLLIKHSSLSILWSVDVKNLLMGMCSSIPSLKEYLFDPQDPTSKITEFKRMMLESVKEKDVIGVTLPPGTVNVQGFANDKYLTSTGFFSSRYKASVVTPQLESLYRTVDGFYITNALNMLVDNIRPCMLQTLSRLNDISAESRRQLTGSDLVDPLNALCAYGEVQSRNVDPLSRPVVLFGSESAHFGRHHIQLGSRWESSQAGDALHVLVEGVEPLTGLRWCRTYLLARGRAVDHSPSGSSVPLSVPPEVVRGVQRLEGLYCKLWLTSRAVVREAFTRHSSSLLDAASYIQTAMETGMRSSSSGGAGSFLQGVQLEGEEQLEMHLDCVDATGRLVEPEEVQQQGAAACWVYLRLIVHGISSCSSPSSAGPVSVAVGDTFLFTSSSSSQSSSGSTGAIVPMPLVSDGFCITHSLPYYRCFLGAAVEEQQASGLISASRNTSMLTALGLGKPLDPSFGAALVLPLLTDHPLVPLAEGAAVRLYSEGFLVEQSDVSSTPLLLSLSTHVETVWILDGAECMQQAVKAFPHLRGPSVPAVEAPAGLLLVFRLKPSEALARNGSHSLCRYNPLERSLPFLPCEGGGPPSLLGLFVRAKGAAAGAMASAAAAWRVACRVHKIAEHRSGSEVPLPPSILRSFLTALDVWSFSASCASLGASSEDSSSGGSSSSLIASGVTFLQSSAASPQQQFPGLGCLPLRAMHALTVRLRLNSADFDSNLLVLPADAGDDEEPASPAAAPRGLTSGSKKASFYKTFDDVSHSSNSSGGGASPENKKVSHKEVPAAAAAAPPPPPPSYHSVVSPSVTFSLPPEQPPQQQAPAPPAAAAPTVSSTTVEVCKRCESAVPQLQAELSEALEIMKAQHEDNLRLSRAIETLNQQHDRDMREISQSVSSSGEEQRALEAALKKSQQELRNNTAKYEKQTTDLQIQLNSLAEQLKTCELLSAQKDSKIALLVQEYHLAEDRSEAKIEQLVAANQELTDKLNSVGSDFSSIQRAAQQSFDDYDHNARVYEERIEALEAEVEQKTALMGQQAREIKSLSEKIATMNKNHQMEREHLSLLIDSKEADTQAALAQQEALLLRMRQEEERQQQFKSETNAATLALRSRIGQLEAAVEAEKRAAAQALLDATKAQADLMLLQTERDERVRELEGKLRLYNADNRQLQDKHATACAGYEERLREMTSAAEETAAELEAKNDKIVEMQLDLVKKEAAITVFTSSVDSLKKEVAALQSRETTSAAAAAAMSQKQAELEEQLAARTNSLNTLNERYNTITKQYNALCTDVFKQSDSINKDDYIINNTKEVADLQAANDQLQERIAQLTAQCEEQEGRMAAAAEAHQSTVSSMNTEMQRYSILVNQLQFSVSEGAKRLAELEASKESEVNQLLNELTELNEENEKMNADAAAMSFELRGEVASLVEQLQDLERELEAVRSRLVEQTEEARERQERDGESLAQLQAARDLLASQLSEATAAREAEAAQANERVNMLVESLTSKAREARQLQEELEAVKLLLSNANNELRASKASVGYQNSNISNGYGKNVQPYPNPTAAPAGYEASAAAAPSPAVGSSGVGSNNSNIPAHVLAEIEALVAQGMSHDQAIETYFINMNNKLLVGGGGGAAAGTGSDRGSNLSDTHSEHSYSLLSNRTPFTNSSSTAAAASSAPAAPLSSSRGQGSTPVASQHKGIAAGPYASSSSDLLKSRSDSSSNLLSGGYPRGGGVSVDPALSHSGSFTNKTTAAAAAASQGSAGLLSSNSGSGKYDSKVGKSKRDPDQEALEFAILLSQQEQEYGVNMIDSLTLADEDAIKEYRDSGCSRAEAVLLVFQQKYGKPGSRSSASDRRGVVATPPAPAGLSSLQSPSTSSSLRKGSFSQHSPQQQQPSRPALRHASSSVSAAINMEYSDYDEREIDRIMQTTGCSRAEATSLHFRHNSSSSGSGSNALHRAVSPLDRRPSLPGDTSRSPEAAARRPSAVARDLSPTRIGHSINNAAGSGSELMRSRSPVPAVNPGGRQQLSSSSNSGSAAAAISGVTSPLRGSITSPPLEANSMFPPHSAAADRTRSPARPSLSGGRPAPMQRAYTAAPSSAGAAGGFLDERSHSSDQVSFNANQYYHRK